MMLHIYRIWNDQYRKSDYKQQDKGKGAVTIQSQVVWCSVVCLPAQGPDSRNSRKVEKHNSEDMKKIYKKHNLFQVPAS